MMHIRIMGIVDGAFESVFREMPRTLEKNGVRVLRKDPQNRQIEGRIPLGWRWQNPKFLMKFYCNENHTLIEATTKKKFGSQRNNELKELMRNLLDDIEGINWA